jgi:hypothetical protein
MTLVDNDIVGEVWPRAQPGKISSQYGQVDLTPLGDFEVRSYQTFVLTYTVVEYGIDDTGSIRVLFRFVEDWGALQTTDPAGANYVTAHTSNGVGLAVEFSPHGQSARPRMKCLTVRVAGGYLSPLTILWGKNQYASMASQ